MTNTLKLKTFFLLILIISTLFVLQYFLKKLTPHISKTQAENIARPVLEKCWLDPQNPSKFKISSLSTFKMTSTYDNTIVWRVGGNFSEIDYPATESKHYGDLPEVFVDVNTGEIVWKHFSEIGNSPIKDCDN